MESLTDFDVVYDEEPLTPVHSIPTNINISNTSGSKGRFSEIFSSSPDIESPSEKSASRAHSIQFKSPEAEIIKIPSTKPLPNEIQIKGSESLDHFEDFSRKLTKDESFDLVGRLDEELGKIKSRIGGIRRESDTGVKGNRKSPTAQGDVVSRLLKYGEIAKKKNEERIRIKKEREDNEVSKFNQKSRGKSDGNILKRSSKGLAISPTPKEFTPVSSNLSSVKNSNRTLNSTNSPQKIIEKMQKLVKLSKS